MILKVGQEQVMSYRDKVTQEIRQSCARTSQDSVLFAGAGLSKRHLALPSWNQLLENILSQIQAPLPLAYYLQSSGNLINAAQHIARLTHEWAWLDGKATFPELFFDENVSHTIFLKHLVASQIQKAAPVEMHLETLATQEEIPALTAMPLHTVITTNYDHFLEQILGREAVHGLNIALHNEGTKGNVIKIHGCISDPASIVLLPEDYAGYSIKHRYIFSKLLTYFAEHTILFVGYSLSDPDIAELLVNTADALDVSNLENVFVLEWGNEPDSYSNITMSHPIHYEYKSATIQAIRSKQFDWVYRAFTGL